MTITSSPGQPPVVLSIAGFDPSSGAGITADLQVFATHGLFGTACPTALTVQSTVGVARVQVIDPELVREMLQHLTRDMPPSGLKIGMLGNAAIVEVVADFVCSIRDQKVTPLVIDPVLRSSSGRSLLDKAGTAALLNRLLPNATCFTPNREELAMLLGRDQVSGGDLPAAAMELLERTGAESVIVTDGEAAVPTDLLVRRKREPIWVQGDRIVTSATHGTGCAFSSSLLSRLVLGDDLFTAAVAAKSFVEHSLRTAPTLGAGKGPMKLSGLPYAIR